MHWRQYRVLSVGQAAQAFLDDNAVAVGVVRQGVHRKELDAAVRGLARAGAAQEMEQVERTSRTKMKSTVRKDLFDDHIRPIAAIARKSQLATADMVSLRVPHKRTSDSDLASKAIAMAGAAERYHDVFRAQQLGSDFGEKCRAKANELIQAMLVRERSVLRLKAATGDAASYTSLIRDAIRVLNVMLHKQLARRPELLSAWDKCRRYGKKPGVKRQKKRKQAAKSARA